MAALSSSLARANSPRPVLTKATPTRCQRLFVVPMFALLKLRPCWPKGRDRKIQRCLSPALFVEVRRTRCQYRVLRTLSANASRFVRRTSPVLPNVLRTAGLWRGRRGAAQSAPTIQHGMNSGSAWPSNWCLRASRIACAFSMSSAEDVQGAGSATGSE